MNININDNISIEYVFEFVHDSLNYPLENLISDVNNFIDTKFPYLIRTSDATVKWNNDTYTVKLDGISSGNYTEEYLKNKIEQTGLNHACVLKVLDKKIIKY